MLLAAHRPVGHWSTVLPQHRSCRVTGVSGFDDRDWCQTPTELVWGSLVLSFPSLVHPVYLLPVLPVKAGLSMKLGKHWGKLGRLLFDTLHLWFHLSWPDCGALRVGNQILTDLSTDTSWWASLASAWRRIDSCSCRHTNLKSVSLSCSHTHTHTYIYHSRKC